MKKLLALVCSAMMFASCGAQKEKALVVYYSQSNTTKTVAQEIQKQLGCDIAEIECVEPFTGDFNAVVSRWQEDQKAGKLPELKPLAKNISDYDVIFLGYPIWGGVYASPISSFLKTADFNGKKLVPFCTFGSGGLNTSVDELKKNVKNATILEGYGIRQARIANVSSEVDQFLIKGRFKQGTLEQLPDFSAQKECTDQEKEIFTEATSGYQFPLGEATSVAQRKINGGTEYLFNVEGQNGAKSQIYVIAKDGAKPEFTQVVR